MILAIDAASTDLGLALVDPSGAAVAEDAWMSVHRQSAELLPRLEAMLDGAGLETRAIDAIAVGTGPGSFTGLRVAMSLAKGLAIGLGRPIVGVASLPAWLDAEPAAGAALARAGAREAYLLPRDGDEVLVVERDAAHERLRTTPVVASDELATALGLERATSPRGAVAIARRAAERLATDPAGDDVRRLEPLYLRAPRGVVAAGEAKVRWL